MIRFLDILLSGAFLFLLSPLFLILYSLIYMSSKGKGIFTQERIGKGGVKFELYKFRTMRQDADRQGLITIGGKDPRITRIGFYLRKYKLDELPQLWNVLIGDMSFVGPRPEVEKYTKLYNEEQKKVLSVRPGITDWASIRYMDENKILGKSKNPEKAYVEQIMPDKIRYNMIWIGHQGVIEYFKIIFYTFIKLFR